MPYSTSKGKEMIRKLIVESGFVNILDVGVGSGAYGRLLRDVGGVKITGIDAVDYRNRYKRLNDLYDAYYVVDMRDETFWSNAGRFNCVIFGDVIEHVSVQDAKKVLQCAKAVSDCIIVAVPYLAPQDEAGFGKYEIHIQDDLTDKIFKERYPGFRLIKMYYHKGRPYCGYYIWEKYLRR